MASKKDILRKIRILLNQQFDTPHAAFAFFDKSGDGKLNRSEIKKMLAAAEISGFLTGIVSRTLIKELDKDKDSSVTWPEFKDEVKKLLSKK